MSHLMIDLETLGTAVNAPIISIGAVFFDPNTGKLGEEFNQSVDLASALKFGKASGDTIKWWMGQDDNARKSVTRGILTIEEVLSGFVTFVHKKDVNFLRVWGNGATFDISILEVAFTRVLGKPAPWKFWNVRDCRTIRELGDGIVEYEFVREGTHHDALDDAKFQAKWVSAYWQGIRKPKSESEIDDLL